MADGRPRSLAITGEKFLPYALAIGQMALAWNELHEALGILFARTLSTNIDRNLQSAAIWGAITSDRQKRLVLEAAIGLVSDEIHARFPDLGKDVGWVINRTNSLEDKRNNVVHSPLAEVNSFLVAALAKVQVGDIIPGGVLNERALKLTKSTVHVGKDLLKEVIVYRDYAETLAVFSDAIFSEWRKPTGTWPQRPILPQLKDKE